MSRSKGTFNFAANFEGLLKAPIDSRQLVGTYGDLTSIASWSGSTGDWLYNGAIVAVGSDPTTANNGIYWLCDSTDYTNPTNWIKAGVGIGTLTGATNGLTVSGELVGLGGTLTGNTIFTDNRVTPTGLEYAGDYGTTFTLRSLVDRAYVDGIASGLKAKQAVLFATTGDTVLSGLTAVDGVIPTTGDRILIKNQISGVTNGIYSASTGTWGRTADFDGTPSGEVAAGVYMWILSGDTNKGSAWVLNTDNPIIGVSALTFVQFNQVQGVIGGVGIIISAETGNYVVDFDGANVVGSGLSWNGSQINISNINAFTGASSGLHISGDNIVLGGLLTGDTLIELPAAAKTNFIVGQDASSWLGGRIEVCRDNINISGNSALIGARTDSYNESKIKFDSTTGLTISTCIGGTPHSVKLGNNALVYDANYSAEYVARSIPDVAYVTGNTISTANNGLTKVGRNVQLGGSLTGDTYIDIVGTSSRCLSICDANTNKLFSVATGETYLGSTGVGYVQVEPTRVSAGAPNAEWGLNCGGVCSYFYQGQSAICLTDTKFTVRSGTDLAGVQYCTNYCATFVNRSLVDKQYVDNAVISSSGSTFTSDITVSIASGKTFGRYVNGDIIPASGKTANQVIIMSLLEPLTPTLTLSSVGDSIDFGLAAKIVNLNFSYIINSFNASVTSALVEYDRGFGYITLTTTTLTPTGYTHNINDSGNRFNATPITYRYTVIDSEGATGQTTYVVTPQAYAVPTIAPTYTGSIELYETQTLREVGNKNTDVAGTITSNRSLVLITGYTIQINVNSAGWTNLTTVTFAGVTPKTITTYNDTSASATATSILYRVVARDEYTITTGSTYTITLRYASYYGYSTNTSLISAQIVALGNQGLLASRVRTMILTAPVSYYTYVAYPASYGDLTSAIMDGASPVLGAFTKLTAVVVTNFYGQTVSTNVYKSNATNAFTANSVAFA
jgi:hypothetical protein